jgi:hypothetical protein
MFSLRLVRTIALVLGLAWLPMSTFAQICATHSVAMKTGGTHHPAMPQSAAEVHAAHLDALYADSHIVVIDAGTFWHSVDSYDDGCDAKSVCAFASAVAAPLNGSSISIDSAATMTASLASFPASLERAPATPPPRRVSL